MSAPKTQPTAVTLEDFLASTIDVSRHADCRAIAAMMQRATGEPPVMWGAIVGFGRYAYQYASGRKGEWPIVAFSPRKAEYTIYIMPGFTHLADLLAALGKHKTAKACLYVKRLSDVDVNVLEKIIATSVATMKSKKMRDAVGAV